MAYDDETASHSNSPLVPWILVVAACILGVGASFSFYTRAEASALLLKTAKGQADDYRQRAATSEGQLAAAKQQLDDMTKKLQAVTTDRDQLSARTTDLTNQLTQAQTALAPTTKGKKGKPAHKRHH